MKGLKAFRAASARVLVDDRDDFDTFEVVLVPKNLKRKTTGRDIGQALAALIKGHGPRFERDALRITISPIVACEDCGCTDDNACEGGCSWVDVNLCSRCAHDRAQREGKKGKASS